jgi:hypothetical protein
MSRAHKNRIVVAIVALCLLEGMGKRLSAQDKPPQGEWIFKAEKRVVVRLYDDNLLGLGYLNDLGEFVPNQNVPPFDAIHYHEKYKHLGIYNESGVPMVDFVYEYRAGKLIFGTLGPGYFAPAVGKKVIPFEEYEYDPVRQFRIYNLPGKFVKKSELKPEKKQEK